MPKTKLWEDIESHQRLHVEEHSYWMAYWLVGLTDGDGSFSIDRQIKPNGHIVWNLVFQISLSKYNMRAIIKAKQCLGAGNIKITPDKMITLRIRDRKQLRQYVFPIFDNISLLSNKYYDYARLRQIADLLDEPPGCLEPKAQTTQIEALWCGTTTSVGKETNADVVVSTKKEPKCKNRDDIAPIWSKILSSTELQHFKKTGEFIQEFNQAQLSEILTLPWVSGFIEAEGSFYICKKDQKRYCHGFVLSQSGNKLLLEALRKYLKIEAKVKLRGSYYLLNTTNWRTLRGIKDRFASKLIGIKSLEFRIWERSMKHRFDYEQLKCIQTLLTNLRQR